MLKNNSQYVVEKPVMDLVKSFIKGFSKEIAFSLESTDSRFVYELKYAFGRIDYLLRIECFEGAGWELIEIPRSMTSLLGSIVSKRFNTVPQMVIEATPSLFEYNWRYTYKGKEYSWVFCFNERRGWYVKEKGK